MLGSRCIEAVEAEKATLTADTEVDSKTAKRESNRPRSPRLALISVWHLDNRNRRGKHYVLSGDDTNICTPICIGMAARQQRADNP